MLFEECILFTVYWYDHISTQYCSHLVFLPYAGITYWGRNHWIIGHWLFEKIPRKLAINSDEWRVQTHKLSHGKYFRCYISYQQDNWADLQPFAEVAYNNSFQASKGFTPFQVATGQDFNTIPKLPPSEPPVSSLKEWVIQLHNTWPVVGKSLEMAHGAYKKQVDKKYMEPKALNIGDCIYLSATCSPCNYQKKLGPKYMGPFPIKHIINTVTVELDLPKSLWTVYPMFHCSLLKPEVTYPLRSEQT